MSDQTLKIVLVGSGGVGKTALARAGLGNTFQPKYIPTLGAEIHPLHLIQTDSSILKCSIWDTAGQEMYSGLQQAYYTHADLFICMYDTTSKLSRKTLTKHYIPLINQITPNAHTIIVANKSDLHPTLHHNDTPISVKHNNWFTAYQQILATINKHVIDYITPL